MPDLFPSGWGLRLALVVAAAVAATAFVIVLVGEATHYADLAHRLRHAAVGWLAVCAAGEATAYVGYLAGYRAMAALDGGPRLAISVALRVVALAFGAFSLATAVGGLAVDFWALREAGEPPARASARVIAFETLRWAVLGVATCSARGRRCGRSGSRSGSARCSSATPPATCPRRCPCPPVARAGSMRP